MRLSGFELAIDWRTLKWIDDHLANKIPFEGEDSYGDTVESFSIDTEDGYSWLIRVKNYDGIYAFDGPQLDVQLLLNGESVSGMKEYTNILSNNTFSCIHNDIFHVLLIRDYNADIN